MATVQKPTEAQQQQQPQSAKREQEWSARKIVTLSGDFRSRLDNTSIRALAPYKAGLAFGRATETISAIFKKLIDNGIQSIPIEDRDAHRWIGFIDVVDIVEYCISILGLDTKKTPSPMLEKLMSEKLLTTTPCTAIIARSRRTDWHAVKNSAKLAEVIDLMTKSGVHRVAVLTDDNQIESVVSQSRLVNWLCRHVNENPGAVFSHDEMEAGLDTFQFGTREVITIPQERNALSAFLTIYRNQVSGVGVVDAKGNLIGNISASDIKVIGHKAEGFERLYDSAPAFIDWRTTVRHHEVPRVVSLPANASLNQLFDKFHQYKAHVHRIYLTESEKPLAVVSLVDLLKLFAHTGDRTA